METRPVSFSKTTMTELVLPSHTNAIGTIFGGTIMSWMDIAAAICAQRHAQKQVLQLLLCNGHMEQHSEP